MIPARRSPNRASSPPRLWIFSLVDLLSLYKLFGLLQLVELLPAQVFIDLRHALIQAIEIKNH